MDYDYTKWQISADRAKNVCKVSQGAATCRYITCINGNMCCAQHDPRLAKALDDLCEQGALKGCGVNCEGLAPFPVSIVVEE